MKEENSQTGYKKKTYILNGATKGDWQGEFTYVGARGSIVIDFVFANEKANDKTIEFRIGDRVESNHLPLIMVTEKEEEGGLQGGGGKRKGGAVMKWIGW